MRINVDTWGCFDKLIKGLLVLFTVSITLLGCAGHAGEQKPARPWPSDSPFPFFPNLVYVYPAPAQQVYPALLSVLTENKFRFVEDEDKDALRRINRYGKVSTDYLIYEEGGKKYRKKCTASVFVIPDYPNYSDVLMTCFWDVYEFGFGRGGIHNFWYLFKWKKDWYSEPGIYVVEDMLELIREKLGLKHDEVIRPRIYLSVDSEPPFIIRYEAERIIKENKSRQFSFYTDSVGYAQKRWHVVHDAKSGEVFEKSYFKAQNYLYQGRVIKTVITITSESSDVVGSREYYFYENGKTAYFFEKQVSSRMINQEKYKKLAPGPYIVETRRLFDKAGKEIKVGQLKRGHISSTGEELYHLVDKVRQVDFGFEIYQDANSLPFRSMMHDATP